jgi:ribosomal protein S18 acetylase RimI-like enzyme
VPLNGELLNVHVGTPALTESDFYLRATATLLASWDVDARGSAGAELVRSDAFAAGVFPNDPERSVFNNVLIRRGLGRVERGQAIDDLRSVYLKAGIDRYAVWAHESDGPLRVELSGGGFKLEETTRLMVMSLEDIEVQPGAIGVERFDWQRYLRYLRSEGLPGLLSGTDPDAYHVLGVRIGSQDAATAIAFDHDGDCGIFNMGTLEAYRRRGLATAILTQHLHEAAERGCSTASLQSTPIAEGVYRSVGFHDLGHFFEYVPVAPRQ